MKVVLFRLRLEQFRFSAGGFRSGIAKLCRGGGDSLFAGLEFLRAVSLWTTSIRSPRVFCKFRMPNAAESVSKTAEEIINVFDVITKKGEGSATARIAQFYAVGVADCNRIRVLNPAANGLFRVAPPVFPSY